MNIVWIVLCKVMNIPIGLPKFIQLENLRSGGYVKEDCIFVRMVVDCLDKCTPTNMHNVVPD